jgi:LytR cell envelope-related transcriptional attenuator
VVLNNTTVNGLATQAATAFRAGGWTVTSIGNLSDDIISTCAYYDPSAAGAQAAAQALRTQFPAVKRAVPKFGGLPAGPIVVVLTSDYASG